MGEAGLTGQQDCPHHEDTGLQSQSQPEEEEEAEEDEAEELGHTEIYADYVPSKCKCMASPGPWHVGGHPWKSPPAGDHSCAHPHWASGLLPVGTPFWGP